MVEYKLLGELPDPFVFTSGERVRTREDWFRRRAELLDLILNIEYGQLPPLPEAVTAEALHPTYVTRLGIARHIRYRLNIEGGARPFWFIVTVMLPQGDGPFPVVVNGDACWRFLTDEVIAEVMRRGYGLVYFDRTEIAHDAYHSGRDSGIYLAYPDGDYGAISAWAWGHHRAVDFLLTQEWAKADQIAVVGHSRGGKTALLTGATDERIALTAPNNSGCCGAGCFRWQGKNCDTLEDTLRAVPYWYSPRLGDYVEREDALPFDQHSLKACVAPRALLSTEALGDLPANPSGTYQTYAAAREVYRFLGAEDKIGIWFREGDHDHSLADWKAFLDFADWQFRGINPPYPFDHNPFPDMPLAFSWSAPERSW